MKAMLVTLAKALAERGWTQEIPPPGGRAKWRDPLRPEADPVGILAAVQREIIRDVQGAAGYESMHRAQERMRKESQR